jgi:hypothetical protein
MEALGKLTTLLSTDKKIKMKAFKILFSIALVASLASCKKKYDTPPLTYPDNTGVITIDSLRQLQQSQGSVQFTENTSVYGIITMDENDGNVYKNVYMQDHTGAINVRLLSGGGLYQGDSVRIALDGCFLNQFNGVLQLDSVDADVHVVKQSSSNLFAPEITTIDQLTTAKESQLIQLNDVQFVQWSLNDTYADKPNLESSDLLIEDQNGNTVVVRTSGYSSFADQQIAQGSGSIVLIAAVYNGAMQLLIRSYAEINMNGARFTGLLLNKDFNDDEPFSEGWVQEAVDGTYANWETSSAGGAPNPYCVISNYDGSSNIQTDNWLISPSFDMTGATAPTLSFDNAENYGGDPLELMISTDYISGAPSSGTWVDISSFANWSSGGFTFVNSGDINISPYIGTNVHIAFRYLGTSSGGSTWELDNIVIKG